MSDMDKRALITGAGRGIGRGIALALADRGFAVVVNDLNDNEDLARTVASIRERGGKAMPLPGDIADVAAHEKLVDTAWGAFGGLECLVNNAGISVAKRGDLLEATPESFDRLVTVNLRGPFFLTQAVARRMTAAGNDGFRSIITVSSANAVMASTNRGEYCISKTGLSMMVKLFALRLAEFGINAYEIRPGVIESAMTAVARDNYDARYEQGFTPINRWGKPEDIGRAAAMLADGALAFSTGEVLHVDGGLHVSSL
ncbi:3-ketoacyl-ACP reductase (plasmid) [Aquamicrobium terrae]